MTLDRAEREAGDGSELVAAAARASKSKFSRFIPLKSRSPPFTAVPPFCLLSRAPRFEPPLCSRRLLALSEDGGVRKFTFPVTPEVLADPGVEGVNREVGEGEGYVCGGRE